MTRRDFGIKWTVYALALLLVAAVEVYVLPWFPILGTIPMLLPVAAVTVAVLEGPVAGAGFGLAVGVLSDALIPSPLPGAMTVALCLLGIGAGAAARYGVHQNLVGCLLCSAGALAAIDAVRVLAYWGLGGAALPALLAIALPEILWSLVFTPLIYAVFLWVYRRVPHVSLL